MYYMTFLGYPTVNGVQLIDADQLLCTVIDYKVQSWNISKKSLADYVRLNEPYNMIISEEEYDAFIYCYEVLGF